MSEEWTKGPWTRIDAKHDDGRNNGSVISGANTGRAVCVCKAPQFQGARRWTADARLIAASPKMYEALRRCVDALDVMMGDTDLIDEHDDGSEEFQAFRAGLAALAEAKGES